MTQQISHHPAEWIERLARFGYAPKGAVYLLVGLLAVQAAFGPGGKKTGTEGALVTLVQQPFGQILLGLVAFGLVSYAMWRLIEAINDLNFITFTVHCMSLWDKLSLTLITSYC